MQHTISIYQRPKQGSALVRTCPVFNYRHKISAMGGYDTASCKIAARNADDANAFLEQHLGAFARVYADNPAVPCWEGLISRITTADYTMSLDEMANRLDVQYSLVTANAPAKVAAANDTSSQAVYGIKQDTLEFGVIYNAIAGDNRPANLRDAVLAQAAWPQKSAVQGEAGSIQIEMVGIYHTLEWETYVSTSTAGLTYYNMLALILLPAVGNGATFFDNTSMSKLTAHSTARILGEGGNRSFWEIMVKQAEAGDGTQPWVIGITPTDFTDSKRRLYYRPINTTIEYTARIADGRRPRNLYGQLVDPWDVRPDRGIQFIDVLLGWNGTGDNPTESYINSVEYDADSQTVSWYSMDSKEAEAAFQLRRVSKPTGKAFGGVLRTAISG